jgi:hypothetical protein
MLRRVLSSATAFGFLVLLPAAAFAQAAITGVVKDVSGGVLPGVTVEASSPVLIEKVRSVVTDDTGQYRIVDLRPGTYAVSFSLPGFSTVRREGVELSGEFVATINADLRVGALEETITVTGETPIVDVQSARVQQTLTKDIVSAIPSSRNAAGIQSLIPGMSTNTDSGGISGSVTGSAGSMYGGRGADSRTQNDGLNTGWAGSGGGAGQHVNVSGSQEVVLSTSGGLGEAETAGVVLNVIPREGSNTFSGQFNASGANGAWQGSNYTKELQDQGLRAPQELKHLWEINPMGGGRLIQDKLWFYLTYREVRASSTVPGMWFNKNAGNPNSWVVDFDRSRQAFTDPKARTGIGRITWQASQRNKINIYWSEQYNTENRKGGGTATQTPEATGLNLYQPSHVQQVTWNSPYTSRMLLEAGWGTYQARYRNNAPRIDGSHHPDMVRLVEQGGEIPNLASRLTSGTGGGFQHHLIGNIASLRASVSYVTGANSMKFGYQGGFQNPSQTYTYNREVFTTRARDGVMNQLSQTAAWPGNVKYVRNLLPTSLYAQDQWTRNRLTLQGGIRYDYVLTTYPESSVGGTSSLLMKTPVHYDSRETDGVHWHDITPRMGASYDVFGDGKTALKFSLGKYMLAFTANNSDLDLNPLIRTTVSTTRDWNDADGDFYWDCDLANVKKNGECGDAANQNFGKEVFSRSYDPGFVTGWGNRQYNWQMGLSVQQEVAPRVAVNVGYNRRWFGNHYTVDNRAIASNEYDSFTLAAPMDSRLPGGGGYAVGLLYDPILARSGAVDELAQHAGNFGEYVEYWHGVDANVVARLRNGLTLQGGTSTGRGIEDSCEVRAVLPEAYAPTTTAHGLVNPYCRQVQPFQTSIRGLATYTIPRIEVQLSGTWSSDPGPQLAANFVANNAYIRANSQLGRNLTGANNVTVNLIEPGTLYADRRTNLDFRVSKIFRYGRTRTQLGVDFYNLTNTDVVTTYNQTFVPNGAWLTPTAIQPARYAKLNVQIDF